MLTKISKTRSFHSAVLQMMGKECCNIQNVHAIFLLINVLFGDGLLTGSLRILQKFFTPTKDPL